MTGPSSSSWLIRRDVKEAAVDLERGAVKAAAARKVASTERTPKSFMLRIFALKKVC